MNTDKEVLCQFCGKQCQGTKGVKIHLHSCKKNPANQKGKSVFSRLGNYIKAHKFTAVGIIITSIVSGLIVSRLDDAYQRYNPPLVSSKTEAHSLALQLTSQAIESTQVAQEATASAIQNCYKRMEAETDNLAERKDTAAPEELAEIDRDLEKLERQSKECIDHGSFMEVALGGYINDPESYPYIAQAKMTWVALRYTWSPGDDMLQSLGGYIQSAHENNFNILISVKGSDYPLAIDFEAFTEALAGLASSGVDGIEIWSDMNLSSQWPANDISGASYVKNMLAPTYIAIKKANHKTLVISGAPTITNALGGDCGIDPFGLSGCDD